MLPYIILMFAPLLVYQVAVLRDEQKTRTGWFISIGKKPHILNNSLIVPVFFLLYFLLLAFRHEHLGRDLLNYKEYFFVISGYDLLTIIKSESDPLYAVLNWTIGQFTNEYQVFLVIVAAITVAPIAKIYSEDKQYGFLKIVLFMSMSVFTMLFSGLRQSIAMAIGLVAYEFVRKKKPIRFLIVVLIAWGFHHTGFMLLFYYPLYHMRLSKNSLWFVAPVIGAVFVFNRQIFGFATNILFTIMGEKYDTEIQENSAYLMIVLFALFVAVAYFFPDEEKMDGEDKGLRNLLLMTVLLQCFAPVHSLAMRMNYYFIIFVPITVPKMLKCSKDNLTDMATIVKGVIVCFFVAYYMYTTYRSCQTGLSMLGTYPYRPFWDS